MIRTLVFTLLGLACPLSSGPGNEKKPAADGETGLVKVEVQGKLVRKDGRYYVRARNPAFGEAFLVELVRSEDKNRALDRLLGSLEGRVVTARGVLRFSRVGSTGPSWGSPSRASVKSGRP
jgi:hypothetical protein